MVPTIKTYQLDGGSKVTVYKVFGNRFYFAIVDLDGNYPGKGQVAHNIGRNEFVLVLKGSIVVNKNGSPKTLKEGGTVLLNTGSRYEISGKARSLVFVDDGMEMKGESRIEIRE